MSALTSLLVRDEVVSVQQIEDALARQVLDGGEIDTALLELDVAPENLLNAYRAASFGQPPASREDLVGASAEVIARLPKELARKHRVVPFALHDGVLSVACAEPLDVFDARGVEQLTGLPVAWHVATELRVEASLAQHYDLDIPVRLRQLAEQVQSRDPGSLVDVEPMAVTRPPDSLADELFGSGDDDENEDDEPSDDAARDDASSHSAVAAEPSREAGSMAEALGRIPSPAPRVQVAPLPPPTIVTEHGAGDRALPQAKPVEVARVVALAPEAGDGATERISLPAGARLPRELSQGVFGASRAASAPTP
ncbi:MAG TPA: hypothetical protein VHM19_11010, partial [Polyangiales bacterium]|nr:hypothetical protein [Polyangiales bacterium]